MSIHLCAVCDECDAETYWPAEAPQWEAHRRWRKDGWTINSETDGTMCPVCTILLLEQHDTEEKSE